MSFCPGVSIAPPASTSSLLSNHPEASSSHYLSPAKPHSPTRGTVELGRILEPGYLGSSGQWDMRPQKGSVSGDLSLGSSLYQLNSKPTGNAQSWDFLSSVGKYIEGYRFSTPHICPVIPSGGVQPRRQTAGHSAVPTVRSSVSRRQAVCLQPECASCSGVLLGPISMLGIPSS